MLPVNKQLVLQDLGGIIMEHLFLFWPWQIIANHHMQSISFASGGDPVSAWTCFSRSYYKLLRRDSYLKSASLYDTVKTGNCDSNYFSRLISKALF
jgi:hypothetical protein